MGAVRVRVANDGHHVADVYVWRNELASWCSGTSSDRTTARKSERDSLAVLETRVRESIDDDVKLLRHNAAVARQEIQRLTAEAAAATARADELARILASEHGAQKSTDAT